MLFRSINQAEATSPVVVTYPAEDTSPVEAINPADRTTPVLSLTGAEEGIAREVAGEGEGIDRRLTNARTNTLLRFPLSMFSSCFGLTFRLIGDMSYSRS